MRSLVGRTELVLGLVIVAVLAVFAAINPLVLSAGHLVGLTRGSIVIGFFALGVLLVLLSGGIDVSFTAVAVFAMYTTVSLFNSAGWDPGIAVLFAVSMLVGAAIGAVNAFLVVRLGIPTLMATLGMLSLLRGSLLFFVGTERIRGDLPQSMKDFSRSIVGQVPLANGGVVGIHVSWFILIAAAVVLWAALRYTVLGRTVIALGSNRVAASRLGLSVRRAESMVYVLVGTIAGFTGLLSATLIREANSFSLVGDELTVIAAVVLGGASITGGRGSVAGTALGVALITIVGGSLVLVGIPTEFQTLLIGFLLLVGVIVPVIRVNAEARRLGRPRLYRGAAA